MAIRDMHVFAAFRIDAIRIGRIRIVDRYCIDGNVFAKFRVYCPKRGIDNCYAFYQNISAIHRLNKRRSEKSSFHLTWIIREENIFIQGIKIVLPLRSWLPLFIPFNKIPPFFSMTIDQSSAGYSNVLCLVCID
jgi:hypothetical protein